VGREDEKWEGRQDASDKCMWPPALCLRKGEPPESTSPEGINSWGRGRHFDVILYHHQDQAGTAPPRLDGLGIGEASREESKYFPMVCKKKSVLECWNASGEPWMVREPALFSVARASWSMPRILGGHLTLRGWTGKRAALLTICNMSTCTVLASMKSLRTPR
jgi:hypothetical protein